MGNIELINVSKQFPGAPRPAVRDCSLDVEQGSFVVLLGPSGCGKTTLLKMVNRLYEPTGGQILINGADIREIKVTTLRQRIGYVIQQTGLFPHMTVAQNVAVVPRLLGWERDRIDARIDELLRLIKLAPEEYRNRYPSQLSGGQQQRVGLARALAGDPEVMLMDEPFGAIDAITRTSLQDEMLRLQRQLKKTILFVTHDVEEALRLADKIVVMDFGSIVQYDTPFHILTNPANAFVHNLVGADDTVRRLSLLQVDMVMSRTPADYAHNGHPTIAANDNLRNALSVLLRTGAVSLTVLQDAQPVGVLTLDDIRSNAGTNNVAAIEKGHAV
ncbi:MAG: ABC transporter ATP-binding protein [Chloroflexaceae bacterium]|nr:ABC transporter ATP-binding protein [Chloroflexaceae bacterium]NJO06583.1 ABC transporter ATP-binding protein [Chloroflexaceae bacterium]